MEERVRTFFIGCIAGLAFGFCIFQYWFAGTITFLMAVLTDELTKNTIHLTNKEEIILKEEEEWINKQKQQERNN
jgi:hypothetical protein